MKQIINEQALFSAQQNAKLSALIPFIKLLKNYTLWLLLGFLLTLVTIVCGLGLLSVSGWFLSGTAIAGLSQATAWAYNFFTPATMVRGFAIFRTAGRWSERVVNHEAIFRQLARFRTWIFEALSPLSMLQLGNYHGGTLLNRMTRDIDALDNLYVRLLLPVTAAFVLLCVAAGFAAFYLTVLLLPIGLLLLLGFVIIPLAAWQLGKHHAPKEQTQMTQLRVRLLELTDGLETLSLNQQAWQAHRQHALSVSRQWLATQWALHKRSGILQYGTAAIITLIALFVLLLMSFGQSGGAMIGGVTLLFLAFNEMLTPLPGAWLRLSGTCRAADDLNQIKNQIPAINYPATSQAQPGDNRISISGVSYAYQPGVNVLSDINLTVRAGQHVLIQGSSGGGKTTLMQLLTRQLANQQGQLCIGGVDIENLSESDFRRMITLAPQETYLFTDTLANNLRLANPQADEQRLWQVLNVVGLADFIKSLPQGLQTWTDEGGASLSGGQRRRMGIARALLVNAEVIVLDEPTEGLDLASEMRLINEVRHYLQGKTLLWISHRNTGKDCFDQVFTLSEGELKKT